MAAHSVSSGQSGQSFTRVILYIKVLVLDQSAFRSFENDLILSFKTLSICFTEKHGDRFQGFLHVVYEPPNKETFLLSLKY